MARAEAPEYGALDAAGKRLVRRIGMTEDHRIDAVAGEAGPGWRALEDAGWIRITDRRIGGYSVGFTLSGWEWWCRQCDAEEGRSLQEITFG